MDRKPGLFRNWSDAIVCLVLWGMLSAWVAAPFALLLWEIAN